MGNAQFSGPQGSQMGAAGGPPRVSGNAHFSGNSYFGSHGNAAGGSGKRHAQDRTVKLELDIQKTQMGKLIGTGGKTIQSIQQRAQSIQLRTPWKEDVEKIDGKFVSVVLHGRAGDVFKCAENVAQVVDICLAVLSVSILPNHVIFLMSDGVRNIQKEVPIDTLKLPRKSDKAPRVVLEGYFEDVWKAYDMILEEVEKAAQAMIDAKEMEKLMAISSMRMGSGGSAVGGEGKVTESKVAKDAKDPDAVSDDGRINLRPASRVQKKEKGSFKKSKQSTFPVNPRAEGAPRAEGEEKEDSSDAGVLEGLQKKELVKTPAAESA